MKHLFTILLCFIYSLLLAQVEDDKAKKKYTLNETIEQKANFVSIGYGVSNYLGDLGGNSGIGRKFLHDQNFKKRTNFYSFSFSHLRKEALGLRLSYTTGSIAGADQDVLYKNMADLSYYRFKRNLDFQSKITEGSLMFEVFPFKFFKLDHPLHHFSVQPYLLGGIGRFKFNPQGTYFDEIADDYIWIDLQPLQTEGQGMSEYPDRKPYALSQTNLPFGFGVRYGLGAKTSLSFEFVGRKLFTDYLDDVSTTFIDPTLYTKYFEEEDREIAKAVNNKSNLIDPNNPYKPGDIRGNPKHNDFYYSFNFSLVIRISKSKLKPSRMPEIKSPWLFYKYDNNEICD